MSDDTKTKEPSLFDYLNDISTNKNYIFDPNDANKNYSAFMINRGLAQHIDTILLANEANKRSFSKLMHHDFLFYSVDSKKRYGKWAKADTTDFDLLDYLKEKYVINHSVAIEYMAILDKKELKELKLESQRKGGKA